MEIKNEASRDLPGGSDSKEGGICVPGENAKNELKVAERELSELS